MPKIKIENVVSFSTEDPHHPASNILNSDPGRKWKCARPGEKSASIVLQLEKAVQISGIDIGNENSAYIEVLVSRSSSNEFKPLLGMTSFMTSLEARNHQNINQVRMFTSNDFSQPEGSEKWDRVKIVCIQQYNKHVQYGLSFVTMHCNEGSGLTGKRNVNKFTLRADSPTSFSVGTLFSKERENLKLDVIPSTSLKGAAAIREASTKPSHSPHRFPIVKRPPTSSPQPSTSKDDSNDSEESKDKNRNRKNLLYDDEDEAPNDKIDRLIEIKQKEDAEKQKLKEKADSKKATPNKTPKNTNGKTGNCNQVRKRKTDTQATVLDPDSSKSPKNRRTVDVLKDVNTSPPNAGPSSPTTSKQKRRSSEIDESNESPRKKMKGANGEERKHQTKRYENLLEGVVFVISGIQNPERAQLRTSAMALGAKYKADWDRTCTHLICAFANTPKFNQVRGKGKIVKKQWIIECEKQRKRLPWRRFCLDRRDNTGNESEDEIWEEVELSDSEEQGYTEDRDTDEEIERIHRIMQGQADEKQMGDVNGNKDTKLEGLPALPNYFSGLTFYLSENLGSLRRDLTRYIVGYDGKIIEDYQHIDKGVIAISYSHETDEIQELRKHTGQLISPLWLLECHNKKCLLPFDDFSL